MLIKWFIFDFRVFILILNFLIFWILFLFDNLEELLWENLGVGGIKVLRFLVLFFWLFWLVLGILVLL